MTFDVLQTLVDYHYWARDRLFAAVEALTEEQLRRPLGNSFSSVFDTVVHLCGADWIWRSRWEGVSPMALPAPESYDDLAKVRAAWAGRRATHPRDRESARDPRASRDRSSIRAGTDGGRRSRSGRCCSTWSTTARIIAAR